MSFSAYSYIAVQCVSPLPAGSRCISTGVWGNTAHRISFIIDAFSMVIAQSFLARTFGSYTATNLFNANDASVLVPIRDCIIDLCLPRKSVSQSTHSGSGVVDGAIKTAVLSSLAWGSCRCGDKTDMVQFNSHTDSSLWGSSAQRPWVFLAFKAVLRRSNSGSELKTRNRKCGPPLSLFPS